MQETYIRASDITWNKKNAETLILTLDKKNQIVELNRSASLIWKLIDGKNSTKDISQKIASHFNIPYQKAHEDVNEIFEMWLEDELVILLPSRSII
jgi:hypothetical protein